VREHGRVTTAGGPPRIGLVLHPTRDVSSVSEQVVRWAGEQGAQVVVAAGDAGRVTGPVVEVAPEDLAAASHALVSLGGDGTMLGALRASAGTGVPVLGVNLGRVGVLVEVEPAEVAPALQRIVEGRYSVEARPALRVTGVELEDGTSSAVAFNDVALSRCPGDGIASAALSIDGQGYGVYRCDAVIVATPMGSTAYSYAAGGPVVSPTLSAMVVAPASPWSGISRPVVLSPEDHLALELLPDSGVLALEVDGRVLAPLAPGARIEVVEERDAGHVVRLDRARHDRRSRVKLSLLDLPLLPDELRELLPRELGQAPD
jgi:NAD+ kinase